MIMKRSTTFAPPVRVMPSMGMSVIVRILYRGAPAEKVEGALPRLRWKRRLIDILLLNTFATAFPRDILT